jgi:ribonuclease HI
MSETSTRFTMKPEECKLIEIYVDGGCRFNGSPGAKAYGSYAVFATNFKDERSQQKIEHFDLPEYSTNNQAEYGALLKSLNYLKGLWAVLQKANCSPDLIIYTDSELVVHQVNGSWKCKDSDLQQLKAQCAGLLDDMIGSLIYTEREKIVPVLGH